MAITILGAMPSMAFAPVMGTMVENNAFKDDRNSVATELQLAECLEILPGPGEQSLLFVRDRGVYVRLSHAGAQIVRGLITSRQDLDVFAELRNHWPGVCGREAKEFVSQLVRSGALIDARSGKDFSNRHSASLIAWNPKHRLPVRFRVFRPDRIVMARLANWLHGRGRTSRLAVLLLAVLLMFTGVVNAGVSSGGIWPYKLWGIVVAALVLHLFLHECSHILACSLSGVKIREAGIAILYWFLPVFYVDRTDSYRLRHKWRLLAIPAAGPLFDSCASGITAIAAWWATGETHAVLESISQLQALLFLFNLNPLLPSDGFHTLETLTGRLNTRYRAFRFLLHRLGLRTLPGYLEVLDDRERRMHTIYGVISAAYIAILAFVAVMRSSEIANLVLEQIR